MFVCPFVRISLYLFVFSFVRLIVGVILVFRDGEESLGTLGHTLVTLWAPLGTPWAPLGRPWTPFGHSWAPLGHPWCHCGRPLATSSIVGATFWSPGAPFWHPLDTPWRPLLPSWKRVSKKTKKTLCLITFLTSFREGCACILTTPVQSKHTFGHYF